MPFKDFKGLGIGGSQATKFVWTLGFCEIIRSAHIDIETS